MKTGFLRYKAVPKTSLLWVGLGVSTLLLIASVCTFRTATR
jgi:hypothetical protein